MCFCYALTSIVYPCFLNLRAMVHTLHAQFGSVEDSGRCSELPALAVL